MLTGGEQNFTGRCERNNSEFSVYSAEKVLAGQGTQFEGPLAQIAPAGNGVYADGKPVAGALGCSVHWFQEHPTFDNGGHKCPSKSTPENTRMMPFTVVVE